IAAIVWPAAEHDYQIARSRRPGTGVVDSAVMITGVLSDRLSRRNEAVADITSSWGRKQNVIGPVLGIPFQYKFKAVKETPGPDGKLERREVEETAIGTAYFCRNRSRSTATCRRRRCLEEL